MEKRLVASSLTENSAALDMALSLILSSQDSGRNW